MKQHKPLQVGDRVRVFSHYGPYKGTVAAVGVSGNTPRGFVKGLLRIVNDEGQEWLQHPRQCVRLRKKAKQETERVELWVSRKDYAGIPPLNSARLVVSRAALVPDRYARLLEVRPGERVLSREDLAKAWDKTMGERGGWPMSSDSASFAELCAALGLGLSKEGGK